MAVKEGRFGRKNGKGFYDYPASGPKSLWPGLMKIAGKRLDPEAVRVKDLKDRFLYTVALEAARCMVEGVVTDPREADVGSILGFGYAPYSGGALSFIDFTGPKAFVERARELAAKYGQHFEPSDKLVQMAERGETFYGAYGEKEGGLRLFVMPAYAVIQVMEALTSIRGLSCGASGSPLSRG